jgi:NTE family protein
MKHQKKLGLSLRGGAGRCAGYIGVFKALNEENIKVDVICGSSMGAILGSMYAMELPLNQIIELTKIFQIKNILSMESFLDLCMMGDRKFDKELDSIFGNIDLKDLKIKTIIQATNLDTRKLEYFYEGPVKIFLRATASFPFYSLPVEYKGQSFIDGDVTATFGADILRENGADVVLALAPGLPEKSKHNDLISRLIEPIQIAHENIIQMDQKHNSIDLLITDLGLDAKPFDYPKYPELIENGYKIAKSRMDEIKELIRPGILYYFLNNFK